ncbi:hypothetical protein ACS0TY_001294 [Phlomoides rotata]
MENSTGDGRYTDIDMVEYRLLWLRNHFAVSVGNIGICSKVCSSKDQYITEVSDIPEQSGSRRLELLLMEEENDKVEVRTLFVMSCEGDRLWEVDNMIVEEGCSWWGCWKFAKNS